MEIVGEERVGEIVEEEGVQQMSLKGDNPHSSLNTPAICALFLGHRSEGDDNALGGLVR